MVQLRLLHRGNKDGVDGQFSIKEERLAFPIRSNLGEEDILTIFKNPDDNVIKALNTYKSVEELFNNLPKNLAKER